MASSSAHAQIAKILKMAKETHWLENGHLPSDEIQRLWADKSAPLATVLGVDAPTHPIDLDPASEESAPFLSAQTSRPIPISMPSPRRRDTNEMASHTVAVTCPTSQPQVSQPMSNKRSSYSNNGPCMNTGTIVKPLALDSWQTDNEEPFSAFTVPTSPRPTKARKTANGCLPIQIPEYSTGIREYDPADYIRNSRATLSPAFSPYNRSRRDSIQHHSPVSPLSQSPATFSDGFTNPTTLSSAGMQRQDSLGGSSFCGGLNMLKLNSQRSEVIPQCDKKVDESTPLNHPLSFTSTPNSDVPAIDFSLSVSHAGGMVDDTIPSSDSFVTEYLDLSWGLEEDVPMARTVSLDSSSSSKSRIARRSEEQAALSARPLAPKDNAEPMSRQTSASSSLGHDITRQLSADGSKVAIQKAKYSRPPHEKVYCNLCDIKPGGFRGPHELRRHVENKHGATRKMWVCKDTSPDQMFLSKCKACREKKTYGAYYNAGAHLRRIHFNPREKGKKGDKSAKARGGDGGGDYPPMDILKLWMEEIDVPVRKNMPPCDENEDEDEVYLDEEDSQDKYDFQAYSIADVLRDLAPSSVDFAASSHHETQHQDHAPPATNGTPIPLGYSSTYHSPSFVSANHGESFNNFGFPPTFNTDTSEIYDPCVSKSFSSSTLTPPQLNTNEMDISSVNQPLTTNNVAPADFSLISSMNSPADYPDLSEHDFFNLS